MAVPPKRKSRSKVRRQRSHLAMKPVNLSVCPKCQAPIQSHHACAKCGTYKAREVVVTRTDKKVAQKAKKDRKEKEAMKKTSQK